MDAVSKEVSAEFLKPKGIVVPKDVARAFGRGFRQSISHKIQAIEEAIASLKDNPYANQQHISTMDKHLGRITDGVNGLEKSGKVSISIHEGGNDFKFSGKPKESDPLPTQITMDRSITPEFISALDHTFNTSLNVILGRAGDIHQKGGKEIVSASLSIATFITSLNQAHSLRMVTDPEGKTTITPIQH